MKIGILTWFYGANYGAKAQAYALQEIVKLMGHEPCMINYRTPHYLKTNLRMNLFRSKCRLITVFNGIIRCFAFGRMNTIYNISSRVCDAQGIDKLSLACIVLGSDAIFNQNHPLFNKLYYGVNINTPKIAFSPSCESLSSDTILPHAVTGSIKEMKAISVRDFNTQKLIRNNTGIQPVITLDPTMLYDFANVNSKLPYDHYILVYSFSEWDEYGTLFRDYAAKKKLPILAIGRKCSWADISIENAGFTEWVSSFKNADIVITDSFHGTVFSIKHSKEFILLARINKTEKILSLLKEIGIDKAFFDGNCNVEKYLENNKIDYSRVESRVRVIINDSLNYLKQSIEMIS